MASSDSKKRGPRFGVQGQLALLIVVAMLALALFGEKGVLRAYKLSRQKQQLSEELKRLQEDNEDLRREIELLRNDLDYLEDVARRELGLVKKDELVYQFAPDADRGAQEAARDRSPE